jgi:hypothetical protein
VTILLTNDDGIDAPGIRALQAALPGQNTAIVAPDAPLSGCSHQINRGGPLPIQQRGAAEYAIGGTPADCTRVGVSYLYPQAQWVLSGINAGGNLGADIHVSGTVAAVREAVNQALTLFLSLLVEATPFLLLGVAFSSGLAVLIDERALVKRLPKHPALAALTGSLFGCLFPVCECGNVPVARRLLMQGAPFGDGDWVFAGRPHR